MHVSIHEVKSATDFLDRRSLTLLDPEIAKYLEEHMKNLEFLHPKMTPLEYALQLGIYIAETQAAEDQAGSSI